MLQIISSLKFYIAFCKAKLDIAYPFYQYIAFRSHSTGSHHCTNFFHYPEDICHKIPPCAHHSWQEDLVGKITFCITPTTLMSLSKYSVSPPSTLPSQGILGFLCLSLAKNGIDSYGTIHLVWTKVLGHLWPPPPSLQYDIIVTTYLYKLMYCAQIWATLPTAYKINGT